ncbi:MAG: hypothetical protein AB7U73_13565 [Pirellulales bacterium]
MTNDGKTVAFIGDSELNVWHRNYPEHWQPWFRGLYFALTGLAALAFVVSLVIDHRRGRAHRGL